MFSFLSDPFMQDPNGLKGEDAIRGGEWESGIGEDEVRSLDLASARFTAALHWYI